MLPPLQDILFLVPGTRAYVSWRGENDSADVIQLKILR